MARRRGGGEGMDAVAEAFAEARRNLGVVSTSTGLSPGAMKTSGDQNLPEGAENVLPDPGGEKSPEQRKGGERRRMGRPPGRLYFRESLEGVNRALEVITNEAREGKLGPQQANACISGLNSVAANLRFERQQQRKAEEEQMMEQLNGLLASNARIREILAERGIIPPRDATPATRLLDG